MKREEKIKAITIMLNKYREHKVVSISNFYAFCNSLCYAHIFHSELIKLGYGRVSKGYVYLTDKPFYIKKVEAAYELSKQRQNKYDTKYRKQQYDNNKHFSLS